MSFMEDERYEVALKLADELKTIPREQHRERLLAMLDAAELVRRSFVVARQAAKNRTRDAEARGAQGYEEHYFLEMLWDIAAFVTLGGDVSNDNDKRRGRRNDNRVLERMSEEQIANANIARNEGLSTMVAMLRDNPGARPSWVPFHAAFCATAMTAYWHQRNAYTIDPVVGLAAVAGSLGKGKQKSAPQVVALALAHCGYSNSEIVELFDWDPAEVRRYVRPARVS